MKEYFKTNKGVIYNEDILMVDLEPNSVDLLITSPPYNLSIDYEDKIDDMNFDKYLEWCKEWIKKCYGFMKPDGRVCLNIPMKITQPHDKSVNIPFVYEFTKMFMEVGFGFNNMIIWDKGNNNKTCWGSFKSASSPFVRDPAECILLFFKDQWKKIDKKGDNDISNTNFVKWTQNVWSFPTEKRKQNPHPAPFPIELPTRCIQLFSYVGDTVFDPFVGSGTTILAANNLKRKWVGVDITENYCKMSSSRIIDNNNKIHFFG